MGEFFIQILLTSGEIFETVEHLPYFTVSLSLLTRFFGLLLCFITIFVLFKFEFIQLLLSALP